MILNKSFVTERDIIVENSPVKNQVWKSTNSNNSKSMMQVLVLEHGTSPQWDLSAYESSSQ